MGKCRINGQEVELEADLPTLPEVPDPRAPSPLLRFPDRKEVCQKYRAFLEQVDAYLRRRLGARIGALVKVEQPIPSMRWRLHYAGLEHEPIVVELTGLSEEEVGAGRGRMRLDAGIGVLDIHPA